MSVVGSFFSGAISWPIFGGCYVYIDKSCVYIYIYVYLNMCLCFSCFHTSLKKALGLLPSWKSKGDPPQCHLPQEVRPY